jgi:hypothetical protein
MHSADQAWIYTAYALKLNGCKTNSNTIPILMHQMRISTT